MTYFDARPNSIRDGIVAASAVVVTAVAASAVFGATHGTDRQVATHGSVVPGAEAKGKAAAKELTQKLHSAEFPDGVPVAKVLGTFTIIKANGEMTTYPDAVQLVEGEDGALQGGAIGYPSVSKKGRAVIKSAPVPVDGVLQPIGEGVDGDPTTDAVLVVSEVDGSTYMSEQLFVVDPNGEQAGAPFSEEPFAPPASK